MVQRVSAVALFLALSYPASAQLTTASISGTLTDQTNAIVAGARVTAMETATGAAARTVANNEGFYLLNGLAPGQYTLRVEKDGFQTYVQEGITVAVNRPVTVNVALQIGSTTQTITVSASAEQVNLRSQTLSHQVNTEMATELPLNGRNVLQLMQLVPDAGPTSGRPYQQDAARPENNNTYVGASGGRGNSTSFYLDGGINEDVLTMVANIFPNPDAIQEFSFETNSVSAKFGARGGGVMNAVTRGGTNQFHGTLFAFVRNSALNARNFFASAQDGLKRSQYGLTGGGPVRRDRSFFFASYQGTELRQTPTDNSAITPTAAQRAGDYSGRARIVDPTTGAAFPGNQVPISRLNPITTKVMNWVPAGAPGTGVVYYTRRVVQHDKQFVTRVDHNVADKLRVYASYLYDGLRQPSTTIPSNVLTAVADQYWRSQNFVLNATYTFRPNLLATFVGSISRRMNVHTGPEGFGGWPELGVAIPKLVPPGQTSLRFSISNYFSVAWNGFYTIPATAGNTGTHWTYIKGNHSLEFGAEMLKSKVVKNQDFISDGTFAFAGTLSGDNGLDFLMGLSSSFNQREGYYFVPTRTLPAWYLSDTWKLNRRLTLILGMRWNPFVPVRDSAYRQEGVFSEEHYSQGVRSKLYPNLPPGLLVWGDPFVPEGGVINSNYRLFDPRVGLALDPFGDGKCSIRAGYGIYRDQMAGNTINPGYSPFSVNVVIAFPPVLQNPYLGQVNPFPVPQPHPSNLAFQLPLAAQPFSFGMGVPTIQQWNFTLERQLPWASLLRVAYIGSSTVRLPGAVEANQPVYNPALSATANRQAVNSRRPMGQYYQGLKLGKNIGNSSFNSLSLSIEKRLSQGLIFLTGYRWSKCLNFTEDAVTYTGLAYSSGNPRFDRGPCGYDVPHQFRFSYVWRIPEPRFMGAAGRHLLGGWATNGLLTLRGGLPFSVTSGVDNSLTANGLDRADIVGSPYLPDSRPKAEKLRQWFNTQAFRTNALGTFGTASRNMLRGPGFANFDFSLVRDLRIRGTRDKGQSLQLRAEFFNLLNRANFDNPNASVSSSSYGRVLGAGDPRIIQIGLKFVY